MESNAFGHFEYLPSLLGFSVRKDKAITVINCGLGTSMFNIVCNTCLPQAIHHVEGCIQDVVEEFDRQPFAWWLGPSSQPLHLGEKLLDYGFVKETTEHAMICELDRVQLFGGNATAIPIVQVKTHNDLQSFVSVLSRYDVSVRPFYAKLTDPSVSTQEKLFVGFEHGHPVVIGVAYMQQEVGGIFSLLTSEEKRGQGHGTAMMQYLMGFIKNAGLRYASLSASSNAGYRIYERLGFQTIGELACFEWKPDFHASSCP